MMIEGGLLQQVEQTPGCASLGIPHTENDATDPTVDDGPGAHGTGLLGHIEVAVRETPVAHGFLGLAEGDHFRMGGGIAQCLHLVVRPGNDFSATDHDGPDRHLARLKGPLGLTKSLLHEEGVADETDGRVRCVVRLREGHEEGDSGDHACGSRKAEDNGPVMSDCNTRIIAPSLLAADWSRVAEEVQRAETAGADWLHLDVMDAHFVENLSFGPQFVAAVRPHTTLTLDTHLMMQHPDKYVDRFIQAGSDRITVHIEADHDVAVTLGRIREAGLGCGLALNPATPIEAVLPHLAQIDLLLVMTVVPGFGGQAFMEAETMPKVAAAKAYREEHGLSFHIEVDGGIDQRTVSIAAAHGANVMVAGTSLYGAADMATAIANMRA